MIKKYYLALLLPIGLHSVQHIDKQLAFSSALFSVVTGTGLYYAYTKIPSSLKQKYRHHILHNYIGATISSFAGFLGLSSYLYYKNRQEFHAENEPPCGAPFPQTYYNHCRQLKRQGTLDNRTGYNGIYNCVLCNYPSQDLENYLLSLQCKICKRYFCHSCMNCFDECPKCQEGRLFTAKGY